MTRPAPLVGARQLSGFFGNSSWVWTFSYAPQLRPASVDLTCITPPSCSLPRSQPPLTDVELENCKMTVLVEGSNTDIGQQKWERGPGVGSPMPSSAGKTGAAQVSPRSVEERAPSEQLPAFPPPEVGHGPTHSEKAVNVPFPAPSSEGTKTSEGMCPPGKTWMGQRPLMHCGVGAGAGAGARPGHHAAVLQFGSHSCKILVRAMELEQKSGRLEVALYLRWSSGVAPGSGPSRSVGLAARASPVRQQGGRAVGLGGARVAAPGRRDAGLARERGDERDLGLPLRRLHRRVADLELGVALVAAVLVELAGADRGGWRVGRRAGGERRSSRRRRQPADQERTEHAAL